jgi:cytochrome c peroxidase
VKGRAPEPLPAAERRRLLWWLPLAALGLAVGLTMIWLDPVPIARDGSTASISRGGLVTGPASTRLSVEFTDAELGRIRGMAYRGVALPDPTNAWADHPQAAELGQILFFDPGLSGTGEVSCATCHQPDRAFTDGKAVAVANGPGTRNTQSLLNVRRQRWFTWDGRNDNLWMQGLEPIEHPLEMDGNRVAAVRHVASEPDLRRRYEDLFGPLPPLDREGIPGAARPGPPDSTHPEHVAWEAMAEADRIRINKAFANIGKAIAAYERRLSDGSTPFDSFVAGLEEAGRASTAPLSASELAGLKLFVGKAMCWQCHHGETLSDEEFHNLGIPPGTGGLPDDQGRYVGIELLRESPFRAGGPYSNDPECDIAIISDGLVNGPENWGRFKTPSLRGVGKTAPYMHAGQFEDLDRVVRFYSTLEGAVALDHHAETVLEPLGLSDEDRRHLVDFLHTLSGPGPDPKLLEPPAR